MTDGELTQHTHQGHHGNGEARTGLISLTADEKVSPPLPESVFHVVITDRDFVERPNRSWVAVCGAVVSAGGR
jgi:hypothetical protein